MTFCAFSVFSSYDRLSKTCISRKPHLDALLQNGHRPYHCLYRLFCYKMQICNMQERSQGASTPLAATATHPFRHLLRSRGRPRPGSVGGHDSRDAPLICTYFTQFGEVIDYVVMKNAETGRSRGFGFFTFADRGNIDAGISCTLCTFMYVITHLLILLQSLSDIMTTSGHGQKQEGKFSR